MKKNWVFFGIGASLLLLTGLGIAVLKGRPKASVGSPSPQQAEASASQPASARLLFAQAQRAQAEGSLSEAKHLYTQVLQHPSGGELAASAQERLGQVNLKLLLSPTVTPDAQVYEVQSGDTLSKIAKKFQTTAELIQITNGLTSDRIRPYQRLKVVKASFSVVVDKSQNTVTLKQGEEVLKVYRCSTGLGGITPVGTFRIANRIIDPPWYSPQGVIPSGDPRNILGTRWLGFDLPGYGIHGTTDPTSIGKAVTQGCVRLNNADVEELFPLLAEGTTVTIVE